MKASSIEHNLLYSLQAEMIDFKVSDKNRWDLTEEEAKIVEKWMINRITEIKEKD